MVKIEEHAEGPEEAIASVASPQKKRGNAKLEAPSKPLTTLKSKNSAATIKKNLNKNAALLKRNNDDDVTEGIDPNAISSRAFKSTEGLPGWRPSVESKKDKILLSSKLRQTLAKVVDHEDGTTLEDILDEIDFDDVKLGNSGADLKKKVDEIIAKRKLARRTGGGALRDGIIPGVSELTDGTDADGSLAGHEGSARGEISEFRRVELKNLETQLQRAGLLSVVTRMSDLLGFGLWFAVSQATLPPASSAILDSNGFIRRLIWCSCSSLGSVIGYILSPVVGFLPTIIVSSANALVEGGWHSLQAGVGGFMNSPLVVYFDTILRSNGALAEEATTAAMLVRVPYDVCCFVGSWVLAWLCLPITIVGFIFSTICSILNFFFPVVAAGLSNIELFSRDSIVITPADTPDGITAYSASLEIITCVIATISGFELLESVIYTAAFWFAQAHSGELTVGEKEKEHGESVDADGETATKTEDSQQENSAGKTESGASKTGEPGGSGKSVTFDKDVDDNSGLDKNANTDSKSAAPPKKSFFAKYFQRYVILLWSVFGLRCFLFLGLLVQYLLAPDKVSGAFYRFWKKLSPRKILGKKSSIAKFLTNIPIVTPTMTIIFGIFSGIATDFTAKVRIPFLHVLGALTRGGVLYDANSEQGRGAYITEKPSGSAEVLYLFLFVVAFEGLLSRLYNVYRTTIQSSRLLRGVVDMLEEEADISKEGAKNLESNDSNTNSEEKKTTLTTTINPADSNKKQNPSASNTTPYEGGRRPAFSEKGEKDMINLLKQNKRHHRKRNIASLAKDKLREKEANEEKKKEADQSTQKPSSKPSEGKTETTPNGSQKESAKSVPASKFDFIRNWSKESKKRNKFANYVASTRVIRVLGILPLVLPVCEFFGNFFVISKNVAMCGWNFVGAIVEGGIWMVNEVKGDTQRSGEKDDKAAEEAKAENDQEDAQTEPKKEKKSDKKNKTKKDSTSPIETLQSALQPLLSVFSFIGKTPAILNQICAPLSSKDNLQAFFEMQCLLELTVVKLLSLLKGLQRFLVLFALLEAHCYFGCGSGSAGFSVVLMYANLLSQVLELAL